MNKKENITYLGIEDNSTEKTQEPLKRKEEKVKTKFKTNKYR